MKCDRGSPSIEFALAPVRRDRRRCLNQANGIRLGHLAQIIRMPNTTTGPYYRLATDQSDLFQRGGCCWQATAALRYIFVKS